MTRILLTGARAPSALHVARLLHDGGARVIAADTLAHPLTRGSGLVEDTLRYPSPRLHPAAFLHWLAEALDRHAVDLVFPTCEEVFHLAQALARLGEGERLFAPSLATLLAHHDKHAFMGRMGEAGFAVPLTRRLASPEDLAAVAPEARGLVLKPVLSRFGTRTLVRPGPRDLQGIRPSPEDPWVAQECLVGPEICIHAMGREGRVTALSAYRPLHRAGRAGRAAAGIFFEPALDGEAGEAVRDFAARFFAHTGWTGQAAFDAILTADRGLLPIECNPRTTSGVHFFRDGRAFLAAVRGEREAQPIVAPLQVRPAMWLYGLRGAMGRPGGVETWWRDLRRAQDAMGFGGASSWRTLLCTAEIAAAALRRRQSLVEASTWDIEWS